jgi:anti-sigma regulatory factor (Ser/Thr protein kinase)
MSAELKISINSHPGEIADARKAVEGFATQYGFSENAVGEIGLCVNEAIANIIRHAYRNQIDQPIEIVGKFDAAEQRLHISLRDWGTGIAPGPLPGEKVDPMKPGGLGLICLGRLMDSAKFTKQRKGMLLELVKSR